MPMNKLDIQRLRKLDEMLVTFKSLSAAQRPPSGWLAAIRTALGMNPRQLADRMNVAEGRANEIEQGEISGTTTLHAIGQAAEALNCRFVYALVPVESLEQFLVRQARAVATARAKYVNHHMMLEAQQLDSEALEQLIQKDIDESLNESSQTLWKKPR